MSWQICCARDNACVRWQLGFQSAEARRVCDGVSAVDAATRWEQGDSSSGRQRRAGEERESGQCDGYTSTAVQSIWDRAGLTKDVDADGDSRAG